MVATPEVLPDLTKTMCEDPLLKLIGLYQVRSLVEVVGRIPGYLSQVEAGKEEDLQNDKPE